MKIKELIKKLKKFNEDTEVFIDWKWEAEFIRDNTYINDSIIIY